MRFTASQIAAITGGRLSGDDVTCHGASIDTRTLAPGALFVPIIAERDGHDFIADALRAGAVAYLTEREPVGGNAIVVGDTTAALAKLGRAARSRHTGQVIGITGSVGKTSVKDLAQAAIAVELSCHASEKSFNNELGVPLTLINAPHDTDVLIVEMGARGLGHIAELCKIAQPTIGIVTWVGAAHTSEFRNIETIALAKGELVAVLPESGTAILNADCEHVVAMADRTKASVITYGDSGQVRATMIELDAQLRPSFEAVIDGVSYPVSLSVHGTHQVSNALAAIAAARVVGVAPDLAAVGLASAELSPWRMQLVMSGDGLTIINDAYNANTISTAAALRSLVELRADRRVAVLGVMAELGERHQTDHEAMAELCRELDIELIAYRETAYGVETIDEINAVVARLSDLGSGDALLVKGSRVAELELLVARLTG